MDKALTPKDVFDWSQSAGERIAQARLVEAGVSPNTAQKLTSGRYPHKISRLMGRAIQAAMSKKDVA